MKHVPSRLHSLPMKFTCLLSCLPFWFFRGFQEKNKPTKAYIVIEHYDGWDETPDEMADVVLGVYSSFEHALECLKSHMKCKDEFEFVIDGNSAYDQDGTVHFEIVEKTCS